MIKPRDIKTQQGGGGYALYTELVGEFELKSPLEVGPPSIEINGRRDDLDIRIAGGNTTFTLPDPPDCLIDGVELFGSKSLIHAIGRNNYAPTGGNWTAALRGFTVVGRESTIENDNSWIHTPLNDEDGNRSQFLFQQGVAAVGSWSNISFLNSGVVLTGAYTAAELLNQGVAILGGFQHDETVETQANKYSAFRNEGIIITGKENDLKKHAAIIFPIPSAMYGLLSGNIHLDTDCNIWDKNNKQIVKNGEWIGKT